MEAALVTMVAALFVAVLGSIYEQRRDGTKTRERLDETNTALRELAGRTTVLEASHQHLLQDFAGHRRMTEKSFAEVGGNFTEVAGNFTEIRERLARIEGYLGIGITPPNTTGPDD